MSRIAVTGIGVITAIGNNLSENRKSLIHGGCGISVHSNLVNSKYASLLPFGVINKSNEDLKNELSISDNTITRTSLLAIYALEEALKSSNLSKNQLQTSNTALITANTVGGMCLTDELYQDSKNNETKSAYLSSYDNASVSIAIQKRYQINGVVNTINTACSSSANAIIYASNLLKNKMADIAIVGGVDSLSKFTINGFNALHILSSEKCKPFSEYRSGLNLGEGAAFLILERQEDVSHKNIFAIISGYGNANDAYHPSSLSDQGNGPYLAMSKALLSSSLKPNQINFINAHGTGTENNDLVESVAMLRLFENPPSFASTKANIGHTLGASGAIEAVYSILNICHQEIYPNIHFDKAIESTQLTPILIYEKKNINNVMSNSFGFGGNCSSLIFSKV